MDIIIGILGSIISLVFGLAFIYGIVIYLPSHMAKKRGRNPVGWILLFLIFNPVVGAILLLIMGDSKKKIKQEIIAELSKKESEAKDINQLPDKNISTN